MHLNLDLRSYALVFIFMDTFINNNKTYRYIYDLYALVFIYTFFNNNKIYI